MYYKGEKEATVISENYCALLVSILSPVMCSPEEAFRRLGIARRRRKSDPIEHYLSIKALKEEGWSWTDIGDYFGITKSGAFRAYSRGRRKYHDL